MRIPIPQDEHKCRSCAVKYELEENEVTSGIRDCCISLFAEGSFSPHQN